MLSRLFVCGDCMGVFDAKSSERKTSDVSLRSTLISRNITVFGRRTSIRLEPEMWEALKDVADKEKCSVHNLCTLVFLRKNTDTSLTAAIRVFLMLYFKAAATEAGHLKAGHGNFENMKKRAKLSPEYDIFFAKAGSPAKALGKNQPQVA